ncbi:hypothetical protein [Saccharopolyspora phatthalungensis]|uniref:Uncharacterized protein n=1 Tax=Saccharopolyspora phatthalungensis TaxID=664693 RepID=A0A840Q056_9PSEU|nr:hypothetical protein [Saccharopolyspora phatthalungensis]MBB5153694.1 hypothetical protein [Saccharopolyspora phatthalungensis]
MYPHSHTPNEPDDHTPSGDDHTGSIIPAPRSAPDDNIKGAPDIDPDQPIWRYDQKRTHGDHRGFTGHITHVRGAEGERLRGEFADVIGDLLRWAQSQQQPESSDVDDPEEGTAA